MNIMKKIKTDDAWTVGALIALYNCQTMDEQNAGYTIHQNDIGFNGVDAGILTDIAKFYIDRKTLSEKQINFVRRTIAKYHKQIENLNGVIQPLPIGEQKKQEEEKITPFKRAELDGDRITLRFRFPKGDSRFYDTLNFVKAIRFRKYNGEAKIWSVPFSPENMETLLSDGWSVDEATRERHRHATAVITPDSALEIPGLRGVPYTFQREGISFIDKAGGNALIGDEMGLGKTIQALGWLQLHPEARPAVIVCPASLKINWFRHASKWLSVNHQIAILEGRASGKMPPDADIYIVNYDILRNITRKKTVDHPQLYGYKKDAKEEIRDSGWGDMLIKKGIKVVIADECHKIKDNKALQTKAFKRLCKKADNIIGLSGTPIENRPSEFFNILRIIKPDVFNDWEKFMVEYCGAYRGAYGWEFDRSMANGKALHDLITRNVMIRRLKKDVLKDLPEKQRNVVSLPMTPAGSNEYRKAMKDILTFDPKSEPKLVLTEIERAKQLAVVAKLEAATEWVVDFLDSGNKLVLFCEHTKVADHFERQFKGRCVRVTGGVSKPKRQAAVDAFQNDTTIRLFIGSSAAKEGLTLTAAADTAFIELWWKTGAHDQAEDRVHRIGQESQSVNAWYLIASDTIEEDLMLLLDRKRKLLSETLDGKEPTEKEMLWELLQMLKEKEK